MLEHKQGFSVQVTATHVTFSQPSPSSPANRSQQLVKHTGWGMFPASHHSPRRLPFWCTLNFTVQASAQKETCRVIDPLESNGTWTGFPRCWFKAADLAERTASEPIKVEFCFFLLEYRILKCYNRHKWRSKHTCFFWLRTNLLYNTATSLLACKFRFDTHKAFLSTHKKKLP